MYYMIENTYDYSGWKRKFAIFLSGQGITLLGSSLVQYVLIWYITLETKSGVMMTVSTLCGFLPQIIIGLFSGVWADRYNRKTIIILADLFIALSTLIISIMFFTGHRYLWLIFTVMALRSLGAGIQMPAVSAMVPQIVPQDKLMKVNGYMTSLQSLIMLFSPALGGLILNYYSIEIAMFFDVITAFIGIGFLLTIRVNNICGDKKLSAYFNDLKEGFKIIINNRLIRNLNIIYAVFFFSITPAAIMTPLFIARVYGSEVWKLTLNEVAFSSGAIIGGLIIASWGGFKNRLKTISFSLIIIGILNLVIGFDVNFVLYLILILLIGVIFPSVNTPTVVMMQESVDPSCHGRVFGFFNIFSSSALPVGMMFFGPLADYIKIETQLIVTGILISLLGLLILINKSFMAYGITQSVKK